MDLALAVDLLRALALSIESEGRPTSAAVARRAKEIAEREALHGLSRTGSFEAGLTAGSQAFAREMDRFRPLSFTHEPDEAQLTAMNVARVER